MGEPTSPEVSFKNLYQNPSWEEGKSKCPHSETTIIDDKRLCCECGEEVEG